MIEYAHIMTTAELENFLASIAKHYTHKKSLAGEYLIQRKDKLVADYYQLEKGQIFDYYEAKRKLLAEKNIWDNKICDGCGQKMIIVNSKFGSFWGCVNFRDPSHKHRTFDLKFEEYFSERWEYLKVKINAHWATDIIRQNGLQAHIVASNLLDFYAELGLEDLREKYGYAKSKDTISGYIKAKRGSFAEEREITTHLSAIFPKSNEQRGIRYKLQNEREKVAVIDLLLSDQEVVNVVEIKRCVLDVNEAQLRLYDSLISFILEKGNDPRECKSIIYLMEKLKT